MSANTNTPRLDAFEARINNHPEPYAKITAFFGFSSGALAVVATERIFNHGVDFTSASEAVGSLALVKIVHLRSKFAYEHGIKDAEQMITEVQDFTFDLS